MRDTGNADQVGSISPGFGDPMPAPLASRRHTFRFIVIVCGIAALGVFKSWRGLSPFVSSRVPLYFSIAALQVLFVWFVNKGIRPCGHSLRTLVGRRWQRPSAPLLDMLLALCLVAMLRASAMLLQHMLGVSPASVAFLLPVGTMESLAWIGLALVAGVGEEIVYRGYLQRQLWALTGTLPVAIVLQSVVFATAHIYQGWRPAIITAVYGLAFGFLAAWRRSIIPGAIAHSLIDVTGGLLGGR